MDITIIGTGYVGLVTGACFAEMGNNVTCVDVDKAKIEGLKKGILPIYEPGLEELVDRNFKEGRLHFVTKLDDVPFQSPIYFVAVGTPSDVDGSADLKYVISAAEDLGNHLNDYAVIVDKSTVPVGTAEKVQKTIQEALDKRNLKIDFDVVSNPEFLKEGAAISDCMQPDRVVVGTDSDRAENLMRELYAPFTRNHERTIFMGVRDAEMTKYAANAMLATKISFMNEMANICECMDVDVEQVRKGIGSDSRIGFSFIYPGCGYGGSCFPKDVKALVHLAENCDFKPVMLHAVEARNYAQKQIVGQKIVRHLGEDLTGVTIALWGLSFKPGTDDIREATSEVFLKEVIQRGAKVKAFDPEGMKPAKKEFPKEWFDSGSLAFVESQMDVFSDADVFVLLTEWKQFRNPDFSAIKKLMKGSLIIDGRNQYDPEKLKGLGFEYDGIGRR